MPWCKPSLTLFMIVTCVCGQDRFYFSKQPEDAIAVVAGDPVTLECEVSHNNGIAYSWQLNGALLSNTTRRHQLGPHLHITRADRVRDGGKFTCIATNTTSGYSITSTAVSLNILWLGEPVLVQLQAPTNPKAGDNVTLRCSVDGSGDIHIDWYRNVHRLSKTEHISFSKKRLHLRNVSSKDNGVYRCRATNEAGSRSSADSYALAVPGNGVASIRVVPKDQLVKEGDTAHFDCVYDKAKITEWYFNVSTEPLQNSTRITVYPNGTLIIKEASSFDAGYYSCVGVHSESAEDPQTYTAELSIAYLDDLTSLSFEPPLPFDMTRVVPEQAEFELTCIPAGGRPPARVWWLDPRGRTISDTGHVRVDETRLIIEAARAVEDAGNYSCVAENLAGTKMSTFQLIVSTPPNIVSGPVSMSIEEGEPASFTCHVNAMEYPVTSILWEKDGRLVSGEGQRVMINVENGSIAISSTQLEDRGNYSCVVNTSGFNPIISEPAVLLIKEKLKFTPRPVNKKLELGSNAKVYCKAQGVQPLVIKWIKEDQNRQQTFDLPPHVQDVNGTLQFTKVTAEDKGRYVCVATNPQGIINATIDIDVIVTPKFSVLPQNPTEAYEGFPVMIHCNAEGDPKPTIRWDRNSNFSGFDPKRFHVLENGSLLVQEVHMTDSGKYGCTAGNSGGFKREEVTLIVKSPEGYHPEDAQEEGSMMTKTFTITLSIAGSYMLLVIGLMIWCRHRRKRRKQAYLAANGAEGTDILLAKAENGEAGGEHTELKENPGSGTGEGADTVQSHSSVQSKRSNKSSNYDRLVFPRQDLHNMVLLGRGEFGEVFVAKAHGVEGAGGDDKEKGGASVLVKALQNTRDDAVLQEFKRQLDMFHKAQNEYVVKLVGLCREAEPHYMILEHTDWGDLKQFLLGTRGGSSGKSKPSPQLSVTQIIALATQVVKGMEHLSDLRFVHRDLAARNCVITSTLTVKVSLPALCKDTYSKEYYKHHNHLIPLRWMPYEAVFEDEHSTKSDVYSFACLVWELFYQGELPFKDMSDEEVLAALKKHELQWRPHKAAPESLQTLLTSCWADSPRNRPSFSQLAVTMADICASSEI